MKLQDIKQASEADQVYFDQILEVFDFPEFGDDETRVFRISFDENDEMANLRDELRTSGPQRGRMIRGHYSWIVIAEACQDDLQFTCYCTFG